MISSRRWLVLLAAIGTGIQYSWLAMVDAISKYAIGISLSTFFITGLTAYLLLGLRKDNDKIGAQGLRMLACVLVGTVAAFFAFLVLAGLDRPNAVANTFFKNPLLFVGLNGFACAGWIVGIFCCFTLLVRRMNTDVSTNSIS